MRATSIVILVLLSSAFITAVIGDLLHVYAQEVNQKTWTLEWGPPAGATDPSIPWTDINGNPETVATYDLAISDTSSDLNGAGQILASTSVSYADSKTNGSWQGEVTALMQPLPTGVYRAWCRAVDTSGNKSAWAGPVEIPHDVTPPATPSNIMMKITLADGTVIELNVTP